MSEDKTKTTENLKTEQKPPQPQKTLIDYLKKVSPGTPLRTVIDDLLRAGLGALIVFDSPELHDQNIVEGGFRVNCLFNSQRLFELCKLDGAIIISPDLKRIISANVTLNPDRTINSNETGTRHKASERTAKQANTFVIAVSERKKKTTLYFSYTRYYLKSSDELLRDISSTLQVLEKQRETFDELLNKLNILEMSELVSVSDVSRLLQRAEIISKISETIKRKFTELGKEGNIMNIRFRELLRGVDKTKEEVIRDYSIHTLKKTKTILSNLSFDGLLDLESISRLILEKPVEETIAPRGYRFLSHLTLTERESSLIVKKLKNLNNLFEAESQELEDILKNRSSKIKEEVSNLREQILSGKVVC